MCLLPPGAQAPSVALPVPCPEVSQWRAGGRSGPVASAELSGRSPRSVAPTFCVFWNSTIQMPVLPAERPLIFLFFIFIFFSLTGLPPFPLLTPFVRFR